MLSGSELADFPVRDSIGINAVVKFADIAADTTPEATIAETEKNAGD